MDIRTLPDRERSIYNRLKRRCSVHFEAVKIKEHSLRLLTPSDLDDLLAGAAPLENPGAFPFWFRQWDSDVVLAHTLISHPDRSRNSLLELGAGLGLAGLAAAKGGFEVTLSDNDELILDFQRVNSAANNVPGVQSIKIDLLELPELGSFDIIAGSEIIFKEEFIEPVLNVCQNCLKPGGTIYLSHDVRRRSLPIFLKKAEQFFDICSKIQKMIRGGSSAEILVNRLRKRY